MSIRDQDLLYLIAQDDPAVEVVALRIAVDAHPHLVAEECLALLDDMAAPLQRRVLQAGGPEGIAVALAERLYGELGFRGNTADYYDPRNSYLDDVLERRTGIPITLAIVLIAIGRRIGVEVDGIGFPGHFLARVGGEHGVLVDPFDDGRVLEEGDVWKLARRFLGDASRLRAEHLQPVTAEGVAARMLMNLKHVHERRGDHAQALLVCDRLVDLTAHPEARRDRGLHAYALGSFAAAAADLGAYLEARPTASDVARLRQILAEARDRKSSALPS